MAIKRLLLTAITFAASSILFFLSNGCLPNYFPATKIKVHDVFGNPCKDISVVADDRTAMYVQMEGFSESYSFSAKLTTNENGECEIPGRFRFAMPFVTAVRIDVNSDNHWFPIGQINGMYDSARVLIDKGKDLQIYLRPLDIDSRLCSSIQDESRRSSCLLFSSFFSAIREGDPNICNNYDLDSVYFNQVNHEMRYWEGIVFHHKKDACIIMTALRTNNVEMCDKLMKKDGIVIKSGPERKRNCLNAFEDPDISRMIGVTNEEFRHFICSEHDWRKNDDRYRQYIANAFDHGIFLYRKTCKQTQASAQ